MKILSTLTLALTLTTATLLPRQNLQAASATASDASTQLSTSADLLAKMASQLDNPKSANAFQAETMKAQVTLKNLREAVPKLPAFAKSLSMQKKQGAR
ncbi:hypothetical protein CDD81_6637 [Ophiocordyceps australis]|uniref:Uncharacterized protein n=1 Tax=Ophiocordyceps australis TaxID=1399860 RepID=A0A2C5Y2D1_9HYPO|nr:hypothetical protein CDD81_6637 [Ophiocordyceps australis]